MQKNIFKYFPEILLFSSLCILLFLNLDQAPIQTWDESTNIQVIKENLIRMPSLHLEYLGNVFFEKPPLWYFFTSTLAWVFGDQIWVYRMVSAFCGGIFGSFIYLYSKKYLGLSASRFSLLALIGSSQLFFASERYFATHNFRSADLDGLQIVLILISFILLALGQQGQKISSKLLILSAIFCGLAFLAKGPFALVTLLILAIFWASNRKKINWKYVLIYAAIILIIIVPWHLYMYITFGKDFLNAYLVHHILNRSTTAIEGHNHKLLYYVRILTDYRMFAFGYWLVLACIFTLRSKKFIYKKYIQLVMIGFFISAVFLILVQTKLAWYTLYLHIFSFFILGLYLGEIFERREHRIWESILIIGGGLAPFLYNLHLFTILVAILSFLCLLEKLIKRKNFALKIFILIIMITLALGNLLIAITI